MLGPTVAHVEQAGPAPFGPSGRFAWRVVLVQLAADALVIAVLILVLPGFELHSSHKVLSVVWLAVLFGLVSALVRPALEFMLLPYVLQTLGLVLFAINAVLLALLALTPTLEIRGVGALALGAVLAAVLGFFLTSVLGLTPPVVDATSAAASRGTPAVKLAALSERLRVMQLYGILLQYAVDFSFDWKWLRPFRHRMQRWIWRAPVSKEPLSAPVKARLLLQDLGPTYVKLGQIISSESRVLPLAWERELAKLQSDVRPFAYDEVRTVIEGDLGAPPETLYRAFNPEPLAAASLAQVHEATMHDGRRVAVKVQRPKIHVQLQSDVTILTRAAAVLERRAAWAAESGLQEVVREFGTTLLRELDYRIEAYNTRRLEEILAPIDGVHVPGYDPELSGGHVLTLEFIDGVKSSDRDEIDAAGLSREELARNLVRGAVQMVMIHGFFHADPHPGNVVVELDNRRLTFLDAGMVGELDVRQRVTFARFLLAFRDQDVTELALTLRSLSTPFRPPDDDAYVRRFERRIGPLIDVSAQQAPSIERLVSEAVDVLRGAGYHLDSQLTLALKAVAQAAEITTALVPQYGASDFARLGGDALEELVPGAVGSAAIKSAARRGAVRAAGGMMDAVPAARRTAAAWLAQLQKGEIPVSVRVPELELSQAHLGAVPRLFAAAVLLAGMLVGFAIAATIQSPDSSSFRNDLADVALVLFLIAAAVSMTLLVVLVWRLVRPAGRGGAR